MKIYPKDLFPAASELMEAQLLKSFDHPCIPRIYDLDQDSHNYYLFEEFIQGESLDRFLLSQPHISEQFYYGLCEQLCSTFIYLHQFASFPVLYRDLKPEHIILCGSKMYLIDFNISAPADTFGNNRDHLGNPAFSAPESFTEDNIGFRADIYSIGTLMKYLSAYLPDGPSRPLRAIIHKATLQDPALRYETVEELACELQKTKNTKSHPHLCQSIAVAGSHHGCGTTNLAFSLVSVLNYLGLPAVYYEKNKSDSLRSAAGAEPFFVEKQGYLYYRFFCGVPLYGPGISIPETKTHIRIFDYGSEYTISDLHRHDLVIFVSTGAVWRKKDLPELNSLLSEQKIPVHFVGNFCTHMQIIQIAGLLKARVWRYASDPDPFRITEKKIQFFLHLLKV